MSQKLTPKQVKAVYLLAGGATTIEVGKTLKLRRETLSRWKKIPLFAMEFERVMEQVRGDMEHRLTHLAEESINAVRSGMRGSYYDPQRFQASLSVLKLLGIDRLLRPNDTQKKPERSVSNPLPP